jgi:hypothetical protein
VRPHVTRFAPFAAVPASTCGHCGIRLLHRHSTSEVCGAHEDAACGGAALAHARARVYGCQSCGHSPFPGRGTNCGQRCCGVDSALKHHHLAAPSLASFRMTTQHKSQATPSFATLPCYCLMPGGTLCLWCDSGNGTVSAAFESSACMAAPH